MNAPDYIGNAISYYHIQKEDTIPGIPDKKETYDKLTVVTICLNSRSKKGNRLTKMLGVLLNPGIKANAKIHQLENEFDIPMESDMGEELNQMCNLSDYVEEIGIKKGIEQGIAQGVAQGIAQGKLESQKETVKSLAEIGMAVEDIAKAMKVSAEQVQEWLSESESPAE